LTTFNSTIGSIAPEVFVNQYKAIASEIDSTEIGSNEAITVSLNKQSHDLIIAIALWLKLNDLLSLATTDKKMRTVY
jgi:hypothetical protein